MAKSVPLGGTDQEVGGTRARPEFITGLLFIAVWGNPPSPLVHWTPLVIGHWLLTLFVMGNWLSTPLALGIWLPTPEETTNLSSKPLVRGNGLLERRFPLIGICTPGMSLKRSPFAHWNVTEMSRILTKPKKWHMRPAKTQISLGIRPVWSESSLCA